MLQGAVDQTKIEKACIKAVIIGHDFDSWQSWCSNRTSSWKKNNGRRNCHQNGYVLQEVAAGSGELNSVLQDKCISNIKYDNRAAFKVEGIDLECFVSQG
jgi:hypothetical protein